MNFDPQTTLSWRPEFIADTAALKYSRTISERTRSWTLEIKNMVRPLSDSSEREHQSRRAWPLACRSKFLRWGRGTSIWKWRRCLPSCLGADDGVKPTLKNLSNNDGDDYENVTQNGNLSVFKHYRAYSISFNSSNVGNFFWSWILKDYMEVREKKKKIVVLCSRLTENVKLGISTS